jgi:methionyl-tRNA synthetase
LAFPTILKDPRDRIPMEKIFIGVAWPYVSGFRHLGHVAGFGVPCDIFARYHRLKGNKVLMVSGSDMHGTPILVTAEKEGATPETIARRFDAVNRDAFRTLGISYDLFTDTHTMLHERTVQETFLALLEGGFISRKTEANPYCPKHARFLPDRYLVGTCPNCGFEEARGDECEHCARVLQPRELGNPRCVLCGTPAEFRPSEHFYLDLDKLAPRLRSYVDEQTHWRPNVRGVTRNFLEKGLHPTPITRDLDWGVRIPLAGYEGKRFYVWFEAVIGYLSAAREWSIRTGRPEAYRKFWDAGEPAHHYYFIGKDNIFFHTLTWPGILLGRGGLHLPFDVAANEWLQIEGRKVSKSRASDRAAFLPELLRAYPPDVIRFYAAHQAPENHDTELDWEEFDQLHQDVLANQYGNLVQRLLVLTRERYAGAVPPPPGDWSPEAEGGAPARLRKAHRAITDELEAVHLKGALDLILAEVREGNRSFHEARPWQAEEADRRRTLFETLWLVKAAAIWLSPYLPFSSVEVFRMLGYSDPPSRGDWEAARHPVAAGQKLGEIRPLFPRPETEPKGTPASPTPAEETNAASAPHSLGIRVAVVQEAEPHPGADKLYVLRLDVGEPTPRTVVAGLRPFYTVEELKGQRVALLSNLAPRTIRKMTSQGMVLAAESEGKVRLLRVPDGLAPGTEVVGGPPNAPPIAYEEFSRAPVVSGRVTGSPGPGKLTVDIGPRTVTAEGTLPEGTPVVVRLRDPASAQGLVLSFPGGGVLQADPEFPPGTTVR